MKQEASGAPYAISGSAKKYVGCASMRKCSCGVKLKKYQHVCTYCRATLRRRRRERHKLRKQLTDIMKDRARRDPIFEYFMERY